MFIRICRSSISKCQAGFSVSPVRLNHISAVAVKELRRKSGAPMMDCKKALMADGVDGDIVLAMDWLRAKGIARASNQSDRVSKEGLIAINSSSKTGSVTLLEINSETDYLSLNSDFQAFVAAVSTAISNSAESSGTKSAAEILALPLSSQQGMSALTVQDALGDIISSIRENIVIKRAEVIYPAVTGGARGLSVLSCYVHGKVPALGLPTNVQMGKVAAVVGLLAVGGKTDSAAAMKEEDLRECVSQLGRKLAMHVVAAKPEFVRVEDVPPAVVERETAIFSEQSHESAGGSGGGKPKSPEMVARIVRGKVDKRLGELCLLGQAHLAEEGAPQVGKHLAAFAALRECQSVSVEFFRRWTLGQQE